MVAHVEWIHQNEFVVDDVVAQGTAVKLLKVQAPVTQFLKKPVEDDIVFYLIWLLVSVLPNHREQVLVVPTKAAYICKKKRLI